MTKLSKYKGVTFNSSGWKNAKGWVMQFTNKESGYRVQKRFDDERQAAIAYDKKRIENGLEPVNILTKK